MQTCEDYFSIYQLICTNNAKSSKRDKRFCNFFIEKYSKCTNEFQMNKCTTEFQMNKCTNGFKTNKYTNEFKLYK